MRRIFSLGLYVNFTFPPLQLLSVSYINFQRFIPGFIVRGRIYSHSELGNSRHFRPDANHWDQEIGHRSIHGQTQKEFENLLFDYGLELDEVTVKYELFLEGNINCILHYIVLPVNAIIITSEKAAAQKEQGLSMDKKNISKLCDEELYKIELPANRYDLLCVEGLSRALRIFRNEIKPPTYQRYGSAHCRHQIIIKPEVLSIRPFIVGAVLIDVKLDADSYASLIDLQDKLHQNLCRKRSLVAIGTHDLDTVQEKPADLRFRPLNRTAEYTAEELMALYSTDSHLKPYLPIIIGKKRYPVIRDENGIVLSMPPIINGEHSKIKLTTRNILIEVTATDLEKAKIVLNTIVSMFSQYTSNGTGDNVSFLVEPIEIISVDGTKHEYPVRVPITRPDILHECDVAEDVAIAYGFNRIEQQFPEAYTTGEPFPLNKLTDLLRYDIAAAGWTETLNFTLCSLDDISVKLRKPDNLKHAVKISNPKTSEFQVARISLLPGLLKVLASNKDMPLPLRLFEIQDVVLKDSSTDVGARNERRLCAVYCNKSSGFEIIHGLLDRVMQLLGVKWTKDGTGYYIVAYDDPTYFNGQCAEIIGPAGISLGRVGVLHPDVITAFGFALPVSVRQIFKTSENLIYSNEKETTAEADRTAKRKIDREEERLKATNRDMSMFKMKSMLAIGFAFTALLSTFSSIFEGRVVAKLPFTPISWIQGFSHRNLIGDDYTDCSFIFLYILCTMTLRQNLQKILGFAPSRAMNRQSQPNFFGAAPSSSNNFSYLR
ncbi:Phenylalanine--tRNA ligase beta subunit [Dirofilaria immitis]|nr:Phenylalanine--tRNA ligase beta subunit [Dirofilaria immitis]